jgi:hypothetical protein
MMQVLGNMCSTVYTEEICCLIVLLRNISEYFMGLYTVGQNFSAIAQNNELDLFLG